MVLSNYEYEALEKYVGSLNSPRPQNIDKLFLNLFGIAHISTRWEWSNMKKETAKDKLGKLVVLRGDIAHQVSTKKTIHKRTVGQQLNLFLKKSQIWNFYLYKDFN